MKCSGIYFFTYANVISKNWYVKLLSTDYWSIVHIINDFKSKIKYLVGWKVIGYMIFLWWPLHNIDTPCFPFGSVEFERPHKDSCLLRFHILGKSEGSMACVLRWRRRANNSDHLFAPSSEISLGVEWRKIWGLFRFYDTFMTRYYEAK